MNDVLCMEAGINLYSVENGMGVFRIDTRVHPGHCILSLERQENRGFDIINKALCDDGYGGVLLRSALLMDEVTTSERTISGTGPPSKSVLNENAGPSIPITHSGVLRVDRVPSIRCQCPSILQSWAARLRHWPPPVIVQKVVSLGAYVTPVGYKGSEFKHMEWGICFNTGEAELMSNLNDTQAKVYVMLKMILKEILKPINKEITSYFLKNIILWQAESNPQSKFQEHRFFQWLHDGLRQLRTAIAKKQLPYYMILDRNLMAGCGLQDALQNKWLADITDILEEGPWLILKLKNIRKAIIASPEPMLWYSKKRMELEMLYLEASNRGLQCKKEKGETDGSDLIWKTLLRRNEETWIEVLQRMRLKGNPVKNPLSLFKRILG